MKPFINSIHYFRGIAILLIVIGHSYGISNLEINSLWDKIILCLVKNGSVYFVFISGFLFHHVNFVVKNNFCYSKFLTKKALFVLLPYILISLVPVILRVYFLEDRSYVQDWILDYKPLTMLWYFLTGRIFVGYWYVPTGMILYLLSPLFPYLLKRQIFLRVILFCLGVSLIVHRPSLNLNPLHSVIYFFPVFGLGFYASVHKRVIYKSLEDKRLLLALSVFSLGVFQSVFWELPGGMNRELFAFEDYHFALNALDINLIQKLLACGLFMSLLNKYEKSEFNILDKIARISFSIYFIHPVLMSFTRWFIDNKQLSYEGNYLLFFLVASLLLGISSLIAYGLKLVLGKNSRYLIGW